jgi:glycosyltransferase involved in cell wall biosynthesis
VLIHRQQAIAGIHTQVQKLNNKKIIFVVRYFYPFIGGLEKRALSLAAALTRRGVPVEIVTSRFHSSWAKKECMQGVPVVRLFSPRIKCIGAVFFLSSLIMYFVRNRKAIGLVHAFQVGYSSGAAILLARACGTPALLSLSSSGHGGDVLRHKKSPWGKLFLFLCSRASCVIALNDRMITELEEIGHPGTGIVKIPNGVDITLYNKDDNFQKQVPGPDVSEDRQIIVYTGRLSPEKGLDVLIESLARLRTSGTAHLYIIGSGPERGRLTDMVTSRGLESSVHFVPAADDVRPYLRSADVFVMPSQFEGMSNAILEAMASSLCVVATRTAGNSELITDGVTGMLAEPGDAESLADALSFVLGNPDTAQRIGDNARALVAEKYNLNGIVQRYADLYAHITAT